jgi:asparagine synthase (glutamine-hydrolysing)
MCGICGILDRRGRPVAPGRIERMAATMRHRGPDDAGHHVEPGLALGFRRLAIIDLEGGHQPMHDPAGAVEVVFNGEIYNFAALRRELSARGHCFRTRSDTEVIVHGYLEWGDGVLERLNGMFGLAVWDRRRRRLLLARDRAGIKPLYWAVDDDTVVFGSEIRAVRAALPHRPGLDPTALALFLTLRYTPSPLTVHEGVRKVPPGGCVVVDDDGVREQLWWNFAPEPFDPAPSPEAAAAELEARYLAAVERQLVSDVPVGVLLSGGVDSALLLALMSRRGQEWNAFTVGFGTDDPHDELAAAAATARAFGARHVPVRLDRDDFESSLPTVVAALEEPVASPSVVPMHFVAARAREDVKVALMGQGPDELFGGYRRHLGVRYGAAWRACPSPVRVVAARSVRSLPRHATLKRGVAALGEPVPSRRWQQTLSIEPIDLVSSLFRPGALGDVGAQLDEGWSPLTTLAARAGELNAFQYLEIRSTLPDELLLYADKLSMAHSLEVRVPFLDHEVIEFALRLPARYKVDRGVGKRLHREVCRRHVPYEVLARPKRGFAVDVVDRWYRSSVDHALDDALLAHGARLHEVIDPTAVGRLIDAHRSGREDHHKILHSLVVTELWLREQSG